MRDLFGISVLMRPRVAGSQSEEGSIGAIDEKGLLRRQRKQRRLIVAMGIPLLLSLFYFYLIGRDRYLVSSEVVVRKASDPAQAGLSLGSLLGGGNQQSLEDARYLRTYLQSPQVLEDLDRVLDFKAAYAKKGMDIFAGLDSNASRELAFEFFISHSRRPLIGRI
jgi:capsular polysaccharide transport system permease protein